MYTCIYAHRRHKNIIIQNSQDTYLDLRDIKLEIQESRARSHKNQTLMLK